MMECERCWVKDPRGREKRKLCQKYCQTCVLRTSHCKLYLGKNIRSHSVWHSLTLHLVYYFFSFLKFILSIMRPPPIYPKNEPKSITVASTIDQYSCPFNVAFASMAINVRRPCIDKLYRDTIQHQYPYRHYFFTLCALDLAIWYHFDCEPFNELKARNDTGKQTWSHFPFRWWICWFINFVFRTPTAPTLIEGTIDVSMCQRCWFVLQSHG